MNYIENILKVASWNANSLLPRLGEFKNFLYTRKYDIVGVCETKLAQGAKLKIPGYEVYLCSRNSYGGGW